MTLSKAVPLWLFLLWPARAVEGLQDASLAPPGPRAASVLPVAAPTPWGAYAQGGRSRLAILLTDPDSRWLPLVHGLKAIGIPFVLVRDPAAALGHRVVLAYPRLPDVPPATLERYVAEGGTLLSVGEVPSALANLFGLGLPTDRYRQKLRFLPEGARLGELRDPRELELRLGVPGVGALGGFGWLRLQDGAQALAAYEDGSAAIVAHGTGQGLTCAFGMDFGTVLYRGQSGRDEWFSRAYVDAFEPAGDVFLRVLAALYRQREPAAVTLGTVPEGRELSILLTHDLDYRQSVPNAGAFAAFEHAQGIRATYFLQTKTVSDYLDTDFLNAAAVPRLRELDGLGHEVASHSLSHSPRFADFPMGDGLEAYPGYRPSVHDKARTLGGSILGELRVSKYLIEAMVPDKPVVSFRPGYLANPRTLPQALTAAGYRYVSSLTAAGALTHLPFRQNFDRLGSQELPLWEFPVTVSDGKTEDLTTRLPVAMDVAQQVARYGGLFVLLIHPNNLDDKLRFEQAFVPAWRNRAWFGTLAEFGAWWEARDLAGADVALAQGTAVVALTLPQPAQGLVLRVPPSWSEAQGARPLGPGLWSVTAPEGTATVTFRRD